MYKHDMVILDPTISRPLNPPTIFNTANDPVWLRTMEVELMLLREGEVTAVGDWFREATTVWKDNVLIDHHGNLVVDDNEHLIAT